MVPRSSAGMAMEVRLGRGGPDECELPQVLAAVECLGQRGKGLAACTAPTSPARDQAMEPLERALQRLPLLLAGAAGSPVDQPSQRNLAGDGLPCRPGDAHLHGALQVPPRAQVSEQPRQPSADAPHETSGEVGGNLARTLQNCRQAAVKGPTLHGWVRSNADAAQAIHALGLVKDGLTQPIRLRGPLKSSTESNLPAHQAHQGGPCEVLLLNVNGQVQ
mmetsp:Transcript_38894/g.121189  ORF Transcript_38894/g.121189 Transcript_38894/m.121189 type:complete len:219 (-) Transcript_38894:882-1538(-)